MCGCVCLCVYLCDLFETRCYYYVQRRNSFYLMFARLKMKILFSWFNIWSLFFLLQKRFSGGGAGFKEIRTGQFVELLIHRCWRFQAPAWLQIWGSFAFMLWFTVCFGGNSSIRNAQDTLETSGIRATLSPRFVQRICYKNLNAYPETIVSQTPHLNRRKKGGG